MLACDATSRMSKLKGTSICPTDRVPGFGVRGGGPSGGPPARGVADVLHRDDLPTVLVSRAVLNDPQREGDHLPAAKKGC